MSRCRTERFWPVALLLAAAAATAAEGDLKVDPGVVAETGRVEPVGGLSTAGQPDEEALEVFADAGYVAVIDLRTAGESRGFDEQRAVESLGMSYESLPVGGPGEVTYENAAKLDRLLQSYDGPVLVHCSTANRVGALLALRESLLGADDDAALEYGRRAGLTRLEDVVRERLREPRSWHD